MQAACAATGLQDFGEDSFREGLEILVRSLREQARLNAKGEIALRQRIVGHLQQRLQIEDWYRRHPEIDDTPLKAPLIGLGLPRTGSTALSFLLAEDPNARSLRRFEATEPCPPPGTVSGPDPRVERDAGRYASQKSHTPSSANGPIECRVTAEFAAGMARWWQHNAATREPSVHADAAACGLDLNEFARSSRRTRLELQHGLEEKPLRMPNDLNPMISTS